MASPFSIRLPDGMLAEVEKAAEKMGMTRNAFIVFALRESMSVEAVVAGPSAPVPERAATKYPGEGRQRSGKTGAVGSTPTADIVHQLAKQVPGVTVGCPREMLHRKGQFCTSCRKTA